MSHVHLTASFVLRTLAVFLMVTGVVIILTGGWTLAYSPIAVGLALLVVDEVTRRRPRRAARS